MRIVKIEVRSYQLEPRRILAGTRGSYGSLGLQFAMGSDWAGRRTKVLFYPADGREPVRVPVGDGPVRVPDAVMECRGRSRFVLEGFDANSVLRSLAGYLDVLESA